MRKPGKKLVHGFMDSASDFCREGLGLQGFMRPAILDIRFSGH
jgi:hypothetical protein